MVTLTINLDERQVEPLRTEAERQGLTVEAYARRELLELAERKRKFRAALAETVRDDAELYRRLAPVMNYLDLDDVLAAHAEMVRVFGGSTAILDIGKIESAVAQPQMTFGGQDLYPTLEEKATALGFSLMTNHGFEDGNKRAGYAALIIFLKMNGHDILATQDEKEAICMAVADHKAERAGLLEWVTNHLIAKP